MTIMNMLSCMEQRLRYVKGGMHTLLCALIIAYHFILRAESSRAQLADASSVSKLEIVLSD